MTEQDLLRRWLLLGLGAGTLVGAGVAACTAHLNFHLDGGAVAGLFVLCGGIYGVLGGLGAALLALMAKISRRLRGLVSYLLRRRGVLSGRMVFGGWLLALGALLVVGFLGRRELPSSPRPTVPRPAEEPSPLVLLCIDGADLGLIRSMVEAGDLPTFRRLLHRGTWGELETLHPTLSPIIWTTLITGQPAEQHGIYDFVHFRLPGVEGPVFHLPPYSGLAHQVFPLLEKLPGSVAMRVPNTSDLRRSRALWEIVGESFSVGVVRWLMTWPVEEVHGFMISGGLYAGPGEWHPSARKWLRHTLEEAPEILRARRLHPPEAWEGIPPIPRKRVSKKQLLAYVTPSSRQTTRQFNDPLFKLIRSGLIDPTLDELVALSKKYQPRFTAANFYTVDAFQHRFGVAHVEGGLFAPAVAERYRFTDRQLGRFLATLEPATNVLIVSDHGFDFAVQHHWDAPPGIFFGLGPAFSRRQVEGLSVFDIAPMCLHLLGLPLAEDMPGTVRGTYREALRPGFLKRHPVGTIPTYGSRQVGKEMAEELDDQTKKELESLGYL